MSLATTTVDRVLMQWEECKRRKWHAEGRNISVTEAGATCNTISITISSFEEDEFGTPKLPGNVRWLGNLCVLSNGRYLPPGSYRTADGGDLIYEPGELSPLADMLAQFE